MEIAAAVLGHASLMMVLVTAAFRTIILLRFLLVMLHEFLESDCAHVAKRLGWHLLLETLGEFLARRQIYALHALD